MTDLHTLANAISNSSPAIKKFCLAVADKLEPVAPPPAPSTRVYTADFFTNVDGLQRSSLGRITLDAGRARILCGPQDKGVAGASDLRTEINVQAFSPHLGGGSLQGKDVWVAWEFELAAGFQWPTRWLDLAQFHAGASPNSPVFALQARPDKSVLVEQRGGTSQTPVGKPLLAPGTVKADHAYSIVVHRLFSTGGDGFTRVWLDKNPALAPNVSLSGATLFVGMESLPYMKVGMYGGSLTQDNTLFVSNVRWATTAAGL